ncbi:MAG: ATP-binding cassette domain-containing protein [Rhodobacteraceae bacterium]|nr:ATP-binding cassette domain-containing protein [Paracoccaceae bacterium]
MANIVFDNVSKGFPVSGAHKPVLRNISFEVKEGAFVAILGFSGSGKSTLMNLIAGLDTPDTGTVSFKGAPITGPGPERGLVFQSYSLMPWLTVLGNVMLAVDAVFPKLAKAARQAKALHYINMVGLGPAAARRPAELSGGMRQRVSVARALAMDPEVLLLDEPLSALDALTRANLADEILNIWERERKTCILITNDVDEAILLADRIILLRPDGTLGEMFDVTLPRPRDRGAINDNDAFKALRASVTKNLIDSGVQTEQGSSRSLPNITPIHGLPAAVSDAQKGLIDARFLDFSQLHKVYPTPKGPLTVVEDFNLKVDRGAFISIIGHSGCGKSTVLTMAAGLNPISKGAIKLDGQHIEGADPERAVVFQSPNLFPWLTAKENVSIGVDRVYPKASRAERQEVVEYYLERVGLADAMDRPAASMSNGMRQRVGIARAFALSPKLLLLDEPFGMLDSLTRWELQEVLMEVWSRTKVTTVCVTHDVDEAILLSDKVVMMTNGPRATIGKVLDIDLPRPRSRKALLAHPDYYGYRREILSFLEEYEHGARPNEAPPKTDVTSKKEQAA